MKKKNLATKPPILFPHDILKTLPTDLTKNFLLPRSLPSAEIVRNRKKEILSADAHTTTDLHLPRPPPSFHPINESPPAEGKIGTSRRASEIKMQCAGDILSQSTGRKGGRTKYYGVMGRNLG